MNYCHEKVLIPVKAHRVDCLLIKIRCPNLAAYAETKRSKIASSLHVFFITSLKVNVNSEQQGKVFFTSK